ncbi:MAG: 4-(cytidine 5'-diphospho)-2-C-methyl-D-erythritol kinase [Ruminococcaceae bacterium]|nr:4-(cytidine 5'-diphospho)-2-C-methyl-D-erythritol kinase [Oscillospiraceae bacterium]
MMVRVSAPAKLNLTLDVLGVRADGYHEMKSVMQAVDLCDTVELTETAGGITLAIMGSDLVPDERNTAYKAAAAFLQYIHREEYGVHIDLHKHIPMQAGMAGGSADAAAVLVGMNALTGAGLSTETLCEIGAAVGADVPFCVAGGAAVASGIGTTLRAVAPLTDGWIVAAKPAVSVSTAEAYRAIDSAQGLPTPDHDGMCEAMAAGDLPRVGELLCNVFEDALALPAVTALLDEMRVCAPLGCRMTGSGSVVFALFPSEEEASRCAAMLQEKYTEVYICRPITGGAEVLI